MWGWGVNSSGALGLNDTVHRSSPVQIGALTTWEKPGFGNNACFAIKTDKTLWAWGNNDPFGVLGDSTVIVKSSPFKLELGPIGSAYFLDKRMLLYMVYGLHQALKPIDDYTNISYNISFFAI